MISRWSSPIVNQVWAVSSSLVTERRVLERQPRSDTPSFPRRRGVFGSIATASPGSGKVIDSSTDRRSDRTACRRSL